MPEPALSMMNYLPLQYTYANCVMLPNDLIARLPINHPLKKTIMMMVNTMFNSLTYWTFVYDKEAFKPEFQGKFDLSDNLNWGYGLEPLNDLI